MSKIKKENAAVFIFFLTLIVLLGLTIKTSIDMIKETQTPKVGGLDIEFKNGTTESEVKTILENYNMTVNYTIEYNYDGFRGRWINSVYCYIHFGDGSGNYILGKNCILERDAVRIKNELEKNEKVLTVGFDYLKY